MTASAVNWLIALSVVAIVAIWLLHWFYLRGATDRAYVRTGFGGRKVTLDSGIVVLPILHRPVESGSESRA